MKIKKENLGYVEGWVSAIINTILFAVKLWIGILSNSIAMIADAWHTLSDTLTSVIVIFGFWVSNRPPDEEHPFGHGRAELISAVIISTLLAIVGVNFMIDSVNQLRHREAVIFGKLAILIFLISAFIKEGLAQFSFWAGKQIDSKALIADGWHHRSDAIAAGLIVIGGLVSSYVWWIDGVLGLAISVLILKAAYDTFRQTSDMLLGEEVTVHVETKIKEIVCETIGDEYVAHHFHCHNYLKHKEVTFHVYCPQNESLEKVHEKVDKVEKIIREQLRVEATIHPEPMKNYSK
ncbi:MAG: cation transporter [Deltaproteobacteria bacterium]|nr:cation transporter [Deltaproteobacteria bacterium]